MSRLRIIGIAAAALAVTVLVIVFWPGAGSGPQAATPAISVEILELSAGKVSSIEELPARTAAFEVAEIRPQVTGVVTERLFTEGGYVEAGKQLYQIDPAPYDAAYRSAEADLAKAKANAQAVEAKAKRYAELVKIEAVSRQEYDDVAASLAQARADIGIADAALKTAEINLAYTKVYAPISGRIGKSMVTKGALVTANQPEALTTITKLDPIYVDMVQPAADLLKIREALAGGDAVQVELMLEAARYPHPGKLQFADVTVDPTTGSVQLRALFPNPDGYLLPGMFVRARMQLPGKDALLVPQRAALRNADGALRVWVVREDNTVESRTITADASLRDAWVVTAGLHSGERIVVSGIQKLQPGSPVEPLPYRATAGGAEDSHIAESTHG